jgi:hypothetical protein
MGYARGVLQLCTKGSHMRLKTAVLTAVIAGSLAGPSVVEASAASRSHRSTAATTVKSRPADASSPLGDPLGVVESVISELEFDLSPANLQTILWDLPGFGPYGTL